MSVCCWGSPGVADTEQTTRLCLSVVSAEAERVQAATRIIGMEKDRYAAPSNVIPLPTRHLEVKRDRGKDEARELIPRTESSLRNGHG